MNQWNAWLPDDLSLSQISIPGSHNSASFKAQKSFSKYLTVGLWRCQQWDIEQQLNKGIRYFDLRIRYHLNQSTGLAQLHLHHMRYFLAEFQSTILKFRQFLKKNPSEWLILQIQQQYSVHNHHQFGQEVKKLILQTQLPILDYSKRKKAIPTVMQLRGKAWLIQAAKVQMGQFQINTSIPAVIQSDNYLLQNIWEKAPENTKVQAIREIMQFQNGKDIIKINYLSFSSWTDFFFGKRGFNKQFQQLLKLGAYKNIGITLMDYPSESLIGSIVRRNQFLFKK